MDNWLDAVTIGALIIICIIATYTDQRSGVISNKVVMGIGLIPIALNCVGVMIDNAWLTYTINSAVMVCIAVVLYAVHIWAGGDCKLMVLITLSIPPSIYWELDNQKFTLIYIYALIFLIAFVFICVENVALSVKNKAVPDKEKIISELKKGILNYIRIIVYLSALGQIYFGIIYPRMQLSPVIYAASCILVIIIASKIKILKSVKVVIFIAIIDIIAILLTGVITVNRTWYVYVVVILLMLFRAISNRFNYEEIETGAVKKGMVLSQETSILLQRSRVKGLPGISDETLKSRLTEAEAEAIGRWKTSKYGREHVTIVRKIPFAIFIFSGLLLYLGLGRVLF